MKPKSTLRSFLALAGSSLLAISYTHAANIWDGGGGDNNWSTANNWDNNAVPGTSQTLTFTGNVQTSTNNDLTAGYNTAGLLFTNDGSTGKTAGFTLSGNSITTGNITTTANVTGSTITDTINLGLIMNSSRVFTTNQLSSSVQHNLIIGGVISETGGTRSFTKQGAGTLTINGSVSNTFTGGLIVNGGLLALDYTNMGTATNLIASGNALTIKGGNVFLKGNASGATAQTFGNVTVTAGGGTLLIDPNGGTSTTLTLGTLNPTAQGTNLTLGTALGAGGGTVAITTTTNKKTDGTYGGRIVFADGTANTGYDWATTASGVSPYSLSAYGGYSALDTTAGTDALNSRITANSTLGGSRITNSLKIEDPAASQSLDLAGNTLTLVNGGLLVTGTNAFQITGSSGSKLIGQNGSGSHDLIVHQYNSGGLNIGVEIANNGANNTSLTKAGTGAMTLSGSNTFTGGVFINSGELKLGAGATGALNSTANSENAVTISNDGTLSLNGNSVAVRSLNSANTTDVNGAIVQNASNTAATLTVGNSLNLASTFAGIIRDGTGTGALTINKAGTNTLTLSGTNTFTGGTIASGGLILFSADAHLGDAAGTMTFNGGGYRASGIFSSNRQMILNNVSGNLLQIQGNGNWTNTGAITGDGGLIVRANPNGGTTANLYSQSNTFKGALGVENGTGGGITVRLRSLVDSSTANGNIIFGAAHATNGQNFEWDSAAGSALTLDNRSFEFGANNNTVGAIVNAHASNAITINTDLVVSGTGTKALSLSAADGTARNAFNGDIANGSGTVSLSKGGVGDWVLGGTNSYTGGTTVGNNGGGLYFLQTTAKTGTVTYGTGTVLGLGVNGASGFTDTDIVNAFAGTMSGNLSGITVTSSTHVGIDTTLGDFTLSSGIAGAPARQLHKIGANTLTLTGTNTYTGVSIAKQGTLQFGTTVALSSSTEARLSVRNGATVAFNVGGVGEFTSANITTILNNQNNSSGLTNGMNAGSSLGFDTTNATGTFTIGDVIDDTGGTFGGARGVTKLGTGTLELTNTSTYTGATTVNAGTLIVNGNISTSTLTTVQTGATLGGSGTVGDLTIDSGGFFSPGNSPGITTVDGNYLQNGTLQVEIEGLTAGNGTGFHDQVVVNGTVTLTGALQILSLSGTYAANDLIFILLNDDVDTITGTFSGLAQGAVVGNYLGFDWQISYNADSTANTFTGTLNGNDIALMAVAVPEPRAALLGGIGLLMLLRRRRS